tara:strand:+ start:566 stop:1153 length:588 start_codon:yes stop_codon:yes gene_type:complete
MGTLKTTNIQSISGSGTVTLGTSGETFNVPSGVTISNSGTASGFGKILQVVQTVKTDTDSTTATSFNDISGMSVAITPAATSSKILIYVDAKSGWTANYSTSFALLRGSTQIYMGDAASSRTRGFFGGQTDDARMSFPPSAVYLDSPSTTSATTYKVQWLVESGATAYINKDAGDADAAYSTRAASSITVMEIGA